MVEVTRTVKFCSICGNVSQSDVCRICTDERRDPTIICVVEAQGRDRDRADEGVPRPLPRARQGRSVRSTASAGRSSDHPDCSSRLGDHTVTEVIIATDPNLEGEATATYLGRMLGPLDVTVTRLASGLPRRRRPGVCRRGDSRSRLRGSAHALTSDRTAGTTSGVGRRPFARLDWRLRRPQIQHL